MKKASVNSSNEKIIAIAGNPNVGKSTIFNALTGLKQHTGNWTGKTVENASGKFSSEKHNYTLVDIPGTYSLFAHSKEEEVARNFLLFGKVDAVIVVCDATLLERNMNLVLQTMEITKNVIVCVNLLDEAKRKGISIDLEKLSKNLGVRVVGTSARKKKTLKSLVCALDELCEREQNEGKIAVQYPQTIENAIDSLSPFIKERVGDKIDARWLSLNLLTRDKGIVNEMKNHLGKNLFEDAQIVAELGKIRARLNLFGQTHLQDIIVSSISGEAERVCRGVVKRTKANQIDRKIDKVLTGRATAFPIMILFLALIFFITITFANYPSSLLTQLFTYIEGHLVAFFEYIGAPQFFSELLISGVYRVLTSVVAVMLPPMAIFFPLFTLLEDLGYLPRIAYNLDKPFYNCNACGKQALTMCMGFGCNAVGVVGARIIDSKRERILAILTNNFVPCNGRFPTLIALISMFFIGAAGSVSSSVYSALVLTALIVLSVAVTFLVTYILSKTLLKGAPSSFTLELPPYRKPQIAKTLVRSIFDRTLFVLARAAAVAAPAGLVIFLMANIEVNDVSILSHCASFLDPLGKVLGLDGVILIAFILGFPANEIVMPIMLMAYMANGQFTALPSLVEIKQIFVDNGWTVVTALNVMLFSLFHFPCSTTLITIKKETGSLKWTLLSAAIPTAVGMLICFAVNLVSKAFI